VRWFTNSLTLTTEWILNRQSKNVWHQKSFLGMKCWTAEFRQILLAFHPHKPPCRSLLIEAKLKNPDDDGSGLQHTADTLGIRSRSLENTFWRLGHWRKVLNYVFSGRYTHCLPGYFTILQTLRRWCRTYTMYYDQKMFTSKCDNSSS
jgi:hypothetical protein